MFISPHGSTGFKPVDEPYRSRQEKAMNKQNLPTAEQAADFEFDGTHLATISAGGRELQKLEWGSDAHIAFLQQAIIGLQEALDDAKATRMNRAK